MLQNYSMLIQKFLFSIDVDGFTMYVNKAQRFGNPNQEQQPIGDAFISFWNLHNYWIMPVVPSVKVIFCHNSMSLTVIGHLIVHARPYIFFHRSGFICRNICRRQYFDYDVTIDLDKIFSWLKSLYNKRISSETTFFSILSQVYSNSCVLSKCC